MDAPQRESNPPIDDFDQESDAVRTLLVVTVASSPGEPHLAMRAGRGLLGQRESGRSPLGCPLRRGVVMNCCRDDVVEALSELGASRAGAVRACGGVSGGLSDDG